MDYNLNTYFLTFLSKNELVLAKLTAKTWEDSNIAKSDKARNTNNHFIFYGLLPLFHSESRDTDKKSIMVAKMCVLSTTPPGSP